jgi:SAM-dependent methyltransferase
MTETHRNYFNRLAPEWEVRMPGQPEFRNYLEKFGVKKGDRILDIGAGTGRMTRLLMEFVGEDGRVVAQDVAERMLTEARQHVHGQRTGFLCDDVQSLSCKDNVFDKVLCFSAFPHFSDKPRALSEMRRVLKPGGRLLILHTCSSDRLNAFHASLDAPVCRDRLPPIHETGRMFCRAGLRPARIEEKENLYWAEGMRT